MVDLAEKINPQIQKMMTRKTKNRAAIKNKSNRSFLKDVRVRENGNLFFYILLGVALFGALAYTVSRGMRGNNVATMSKRKAGLVATDIITYAQKVERAVSNLRRKGCSETEFNFNPSSVNYYTNANAPIDGSCDVFTTSGENIRSQDPIKLNALTKSLSGWAAGPDNWYISANAVAVKGVGPTDTQRADVTMWTWFIKDEVCMAINDILGIANPNNAPPIAPTFVFGGSSYNGSILSADAGRFAETSGDELLGKTSGCFFDEDGPEQKNYFYQVLIEE